MNCQVGWSTLALLGTRVPVEDLLLGVTVHYHYVLFLLLIFAGTIAFAVTTTIFRAATVSTTTSTAHSFGRCLFLGLLILDLAENWFACSFSALHLFAAHDPLQSSYSFLLLVDDSLQLWHHLQSHLRTLKELSHVFPGISEVPILDHGRDVLEHACREYLEVSCCHNLLHTICDFPPISKHL